jgi:hypothetical protein
MRNLNDVHEEDHLKHHQAPSSHVSNAGVKLGHQLPPYALIPWNICQAKTTMSTLPDAKIRIV